MKKYGGAWITCDVTPKRFLRKQDKQNPTLNNNLNIVTNRNSLNDRFENKEHIKDFFGKIGFKNIEIHKFIEVNNELKSFEILNIDRDECDELLDSAIVAILTI